MSAFIVKIIICAAMLTDHIGAVFDTPFALRVIGRLAFPVFAFFVAEGCLHTRNIYKYLLRFGIFAVISEIPFDLAFNQYGFVEGVALSWFDATNVLYTLFLGCAAVAVMREAPKKRYPLLAVLPVALVLPVITYVPEVLQMTGGVRSSSFLFAGIKPGTELWWVPMLVTRGLFLAHAAAALLICRFMPDKPSGGGSVISLDGSASPPVSRTKSRLVFAALLIPAFTICCAAGALGSDYGLIGAAWVALYYIANPQNRLSRCLVCFAGVLYEYGQYIISTYFDTITDSWLTEINTRYMALFIGALFAIPLLALYNGKRGKPMKWTFYAFYPVHLSIIVIIAYAALI